ncbi:unnamed protein product [Rotaria sp. Silwood1]|nr:unnamed protein product [Rotaria sp. Silwood1]CAF4882745.1 unnamed protein product [Rotaria sp. Silwood1]
MVHSNDEISQSAMKDKLVLSESKDVSVDSVLKQCGDFGRFQLFHYFFLNLLQISTGLVAFYYIYGAAEPEHRCRLPSSIWQNDSQYNPVNATLKSLIDKYIPISDGKWDKCHMLDSDRRLIDCPNSWVFDRRVYGFTFTEEAHLVCHTKGRKSLTASISSLVFILMLELTSYSYRSLVGNIALACFAFGETLTTLFAYVIKNWQNHLWPITIFIGLSPIYLYFIRTVIISHLGKFSISASLTITWIYISELFPTSIRSSANGFAVAISRIGAILAPVIDANIDENYMSITFYVYAALAILVLLLTFLLPETKNVPLADRIDFRNNQESILSPSTQIQ